MGRIRATGEEVSSLEENDHPAGCPSLVIFSGNWTVLRESWLNDAIDATFIDIRVCP